MRRERGFTLVEMITVLSIFIVLLGLSTAVYVTFRRDMATRGTAAQIIGMIQAARNSALVTKQRTYIVEENILEGSQLLKSTVYAFGQEPVGTWHLDDEDNITDDGVSEGYDNVALNTSGQTLVTGRIGSGLKMSGGSLSCANISDRFSPIDGVAASLWIKFDQPESTEEDTATVDDCALVELGSVYRFYVTEGQLALQINDQIVLSQTKEEEAYYLQADRWLHLSFSYDSFTRRMAIYVDKVLRGYFDFTDEYSLPTDSSDLVIANGLKGIVDEISIFGVTESAKYELPGSTGMYINTALAETTSYVREFNQGETKVQLKITSFTESGWLDDSYDESAGVNITFCDFTYKTDTRFRRTFHINKQGMVEQQ